MSLPESELITRFDRIRVWQQGDRRAVHKPLLVLLMLGKLLNGESIVRFEVIEDDFRKLLEQFGPASAAATRQLPFWHLRTDGLWTLDGPSEIISRPPGASPTLTEARSLAGGFSSDVLEALSGHPEWVAHIAQRIVAGHFPESLQLDVLAAVGIDGGDPGAPAGADRARRDPSFRPRVLLAYEYRCCVCRHDLRLDGQVVGLEAAHIRWVQAKGPDVECNGLALCSLHHKLFDLGVFTVLPEQYLLVVSKHVTGSDDIRARLLSYHGGGIVLPQSRDCYPAAEYLLWHQGEVFKKPQRDF